MQAKKRSWIKRSGLIMSAVVSLAAPTAKEALTGAGKAKPSKKAKAAQVVDDDEGDSANALPKETLAADSPPKRKTMRVTLHPPKMNAVRAGTARRSRAKDGLFVPAPPAPPALFAAAPSPVPAPSQAPSACCTSGPTEIAHARPPIDDTPAPASPAFEWRHKIHTTVFWIGEKPTDNNPVPNHVSCWDADWSGSYGGFDDPAHRKGFLPAGFIPKQNPFYVALPYNDVTPEGHKDEARRLIPWFDDAQAKDPKTGRTRSMCKGRWIAIRKGDRVCYAQWEDAGPFTTTDGAYVFANARPKAHASQGSGLDVSPAVRDYLGLDGDDYTDWKFVEVDDIPHGPWALHGNNNDLVVQRTTLPAAVALSHSSAPKRHTRGS